MAKVSILPPDVAAKYRYTFTAPVVRLANDDVVDMRSITLATADKLVKAGFKHLVPKPDPEPEPEKPKAQPKGKK